MILHCNYCLAASKRRNICSLLEYSLWCWFIFLGKENIVLPLHCITLVLRVSFSLLNCLSPAFFFFLLFYEQFWKVCSERFLHLYIYCKRLYLREALAFLTVFPSEFICLGCPSICLLSWHDSLITNNNDEDKSASRSWPHPLFMIVVSYFILPYHGLMTIHHHYMLFFLNVNGVWTTSPASSITSLFTKTPHDDPLS